jgi:hypothetical protein
MSMELFVILAATRAPDTSSWNRALAEAKVPVHFVETVDLSRHTGFLPVTVTGAKSGFYFLRESYPELAALYPGVANLKLEKPVVYSLGYGGHFDECAAVFYSASVLVSTFGGLAFEPQGGITMNAEELLAAADECQKLAGAR